MKPLFSTLAIGAVSLFLCANAPARPFQEPDKDKQQEPEKQKPEEQPKPEKGRPSDTERKPQQQDEKHPNEQPKAEPNRHQEQPERDRSANPDNNRNSRQENDREVRQQENRGDHGNGHLTERTGHHNSYRIPDDRFHAGFGSGHHFHVHRGERVFDFGGYSFQLVDPWPADWAYDDDVYIEFIDGEYYLVDAERPGLRVLVIVAS